MKLEQLNNMAGNISRNSAVIIGVFLLAAIVFWFNLAKPSNNSPYETMAAKKENLIREVSASGRVKSAQDINLAFEINGKVSKVYAEAGDRVKAGGMIASLEDDEVMASMAQAQAELQSARAAFNQYRAALESQQAKLDELKKGTRSEEVKIAETNVLNAQKSLADSETNLANTAKKAEADLDQIYDGSLNAAAKSATVALNSLFILTDIQMAHFSSSTQNGIKISDAKADAVFALLGARDGGYSSNEALNLLNGGAKETVARALSVPADENIDIALADIKLAMEKIRAALDTIPKTSELTVAENTNLNAEKTNINAEITIITSKQKSIDVQKITNESSISSAQTKVNDAKNALSGANDVLALKKAGATVEQLAAQEAQVRQAKANMESQDAQIRQAEANIKSINVRIAKTILFSPIDGVVSKQDAKVGEIVSANMPITFLISEGKFELEVNIAEADVVNIKIGQKTRIDLDAFGNGPEIIGTIAKIDPSQTIIGGATYYKTTVVIDEENDKIKSGMTADVWIKIIEKDGVIAVPLAALKEKNGKKYIEVLEGQKAKEKEVVVGEKGNGGVIEIISGLNEGENIIISDKSKKQ